MVEEQARRTPDAVAVTCDGEHLTYAELDRRAGRLARSVREHGAGRGDTVAVMLPRSAETVVAVLAVLKAGAAYVPVDPGHPAERIRTVLDDSGPRSSSYAARRPPYRRGRPCSTSTGSGPAPTPSRTATRPYRPARTTSRTSSTPPAPPVGPRAWRSGTAASPATSPTSPAPSRWTSGTWSSPAPPSPSTLRPRPVRPLSAGARVVLASDDQARDPEALLALMEEERVTAVLSVVPSMLGELAATAPGPLRAPLRLVMTTGEALTAGCARDVRRLGEGIRLINQYGPTECTNTSTYHTVTDEDIDSGRIPIGRPIPGARCLVLGEHLEPVPTGAVGELFIAGPGVARGYLGDPPAPPPPTSPTPTARRCHDVPHRRPGAPPRRRRPGVPRPTRQPGEDPRPPRRTGRGRGGHGPPPGRGQGRRGGPRPGHRPGTRRLRRAARPGEPTALLDFLRTALPDAMVPSVLVELDALPLLPNGKVNRRRCPPRRRAPAPRLHRAARRT
ncbi:AMP-binding protein [Streptomyces sp. M19]